MRGAFLSNALMGQFVDERLAHLVAEMLAERHLGHLALAVPGLFEHRPGIEEDLITLPAEQAPRYIGAALTEAGVEPRQVRLRPIGL